jgi:hypothetical protein
MKRIRIGGKEYPLRMTMGALIGYKQETGREVSELSDGGLEDVLTFLWCCVRSACRADGVDFELSREEMADRMEAEDFAGWQREVAGQARNDVPGQGKDVAGGKKKM